MGRNWPNEELRKTLRELKSRFNRWSANPTEDIRNGSLQVAQISNGQAAQIVATNPSLICIAQRASHSLDQFGGRKPRQS